MSRFQPVSRERHAKLSWQRHSSYDFATLIGLAPLGASEVTKAVLAFPLAVVEREGAWTLMAVLSFTPGQNLFVGPSGNWNGAYIPAYFRSHPFRLVRSGDGKAALWIDEESGLIGEGSEGEAFFDEAGHPSTAVKQVWASLQETSKGEDALSNACGRLHSAGLIEPWPITVQTGTGTHQITGLHRVHEAALNRLSDPVFGQLRQGGGVAVAYAQLLSMGNLAALGHLAQARAQAEAAARARAEVKPMIALPEDNTIDWDWSKIGR